LGDSIDGDERRRDRLDESIVGELLGIFTGDRFHGLLETFESLETLKHQRQQQQQQQQQRSGSGGKARDREGG